MLLYLLHTWDVCVSVFMNVGVCMNVYSMCTLWCQPCPSGLRSPGSCSLRWVTFLGRALGQSSCLVHLSLPPFLLCFLSLGPSLLKHMQ